MTLWYLKLVSQVRENINAATLTKIVPRQQARLGEIKVQDGRVVTTANQLTGTIRNKSNGPTNLDTRNQMETNGSGR